MKIEQATEHEYWKDPENCWKPISSGTAKLIKVSCDNSYVILKGEPVFSHHDRGMAQYSHKIKIVEVKRE